MTSAKNKRVTFSKNGQKADIIEKKRPDSHDYSSQNRVHKQESNQSYLSIENISTYNGSSETSSESEEEPGFCTLDIGVTERIKSSIQSDVRKSMAREISTRPKSMPVNESFSKFSKRIKALGELFESEKIYFGDLVTWGHEFKSKLLDSDCMDLKRKTDLCQSIFSGFDQLIQLHGNIIEKAIEVNQKIWHRKGSERFNSMHLGNSEQLEYEGSQANPGINQFRKLNYTDVYFEFLPQYCVYIDYVRDLPRAEYELESEYHNNEKFMKTVDEFLEEYGITSLGIKHFLYRPSQKLNRYTMLFKAIQKVETDDLYNDQMGYLITELSKINKQVDLTFGLINEQFKTFKLSKELIYAGNIKEKYPLNLLLQRQRIIKRGSVLVNYSDVDDKLRLKPTPLELILLTDVIVICKVIRKNFENVREIVLTPLNLLKVILVDKNISTPGNNTIPEKYRPLHIIEKGSKKVTTILFDDPITRNVYKRLITTQAEKIEIELDKRLILTKYEELPLKNINDATLDRIINYENYFCVKEEENIIDIEIDDNYSIYSTTSTDQSDQDLHRTCGCGLMENGVFSEYIHSNLSVKNITDNETSDDKSDYVLGLNSRLEISKLNECCLKRITSSNSYEFSHGKTIHGYNIDVDKTELVKTEVNEQSFLDINYDKDGKKIAKNTISDHLSDLKITEKEKFVIDEISMSNKSRQKNNLRFKNIENEKIVYVETPEKIFTSSKNDTNITNQKLNEEKSKKIYSQSKAWNTQEKILDIINSYKVPKKNENKFETDEKADSLDNVIKVDLESTCEQKNLEDTRISSDAPLVKNNSNYIAIETTSFVAPETEDDQYLQKSSKNSVADSHPEREKKAHRRNFENNTFIRATFDEFVVKKLKTEDGIYLTMKELDIVNNVFLRGTGLQFVDKKEMFGQQNPFHLEISLVRKMFIYATEQGIFKRYQIVKSYKDNIQPKNMLEQKEDKIFDMPTSKIYYNIQWSIFFFMSKKNLYVAKLDPFSKSIDPILIQEKCENFFFNARLCKVAVIKKSNDGIVSIYMFKIHYKYDGKKMTYEDIEELIDEMPTYKEKVSGNLNCYFIKFPDCKKIDLSFSMQHKLFVGSDVEMTYFDKNLLIVAGSQFETINPETLKAQELIDPLDLIIPYYFEYVSDVSGQKLYIIGEKYLLIYRQLGFFVDRYGTSVEDHVVFTWISPMCDCMLIKEDNLNFMARDIENLEYRHLLLVLSEESYEVWDVDTGRIIDYVIKRGLKFLSNTGLPIMYDDKFMYSLRLMN